MSKDLDDEDDPPSEQSGAVRRDCESHRGPLLKALGAVTVVLGLLSFVLLVPGLFGLILYGVVVMLAQRDLAKMSAGLMDPAGVEETEAARNYAALGGLLSGFGCLCFCLVICGFALR